MLLEQLYFKFNGEQGTVKFQLEQYVSETEMKAELVEFSREGDVYEIKSIPNVRIQLDKQNRIKSKHFLRGSKIMMELEIEIVSKFNSEIVAEMEGKLEPCSKEYLGDKLIFKFGDQILHQATLLRGE